MADQHVTTRQAEHRRILAALRETGGKWVSTVTDAAVEAMLANDGKAADKPVCPYCDAEMVPYRHELAEGTWLFGWLCECNEETRGAHG